MNSAPRGQTSPAAATGRWVLLASVLAAAMAFIDATALNVALPVLQTALAAEGAGLLWVSNAYAVPLAALLLLGGTLGDRFGRKRMFMLGIAAFGAASLACALSPSLAWLIAARVVQGMAAAIMIPGSLALIGAFFAPFERGRAIGTWSAFSVIATALGPILGGLFAHWGFWRGVFLINLPLSIWALVSLHRHVPESRDLEETQPPPEGGPFRAATGRIDLAGAFWAAAALFAINFGLLEVPASGWNTWWVWGALGAGALALGIFTIVERRAAVPLLPMALLRERSFAALMVMALFFHTALQGVFFFLPLNLIQAQHYDPGLAGLAQLPVMALVVLLSRPAGTLTDRFGPRLPLTVGPMISGLGFVLLMIPGVTVGPVGFWQNYLPGLAVLGVGLAFTLSPLSTAILGAVPAGRFGLGAGINSTVARLAAVVAVAGFGAMVLVVFRHSLEARAGALALAPSTRHRLMLEAPKFGAARPPAELSTEAGEAVEAVEAAIRLAMVDGFRWCCGLAAGLAWLSAGLAGVAFRGRE